MSRALILCALLAVAVAAPAPAPGPRPSGPTVTVTLGQVVGGLCTELKQALASPTFSTLKTALETVPNQEVTLPTNATSLFMAAPTDAAFAKLLTSLKLTAAELLADKVTLGQVLIHHVFANYSNGEVVTHADPMFYPIKINATVLDAPNTVAPVSIDTAIAPVKCSTVVKGFPEEVIALNDVIVPKEPEPAPAPGSGAAGVSMVAASLMAVVAVILA